MGVRPVGVSIGSLSKFFPQQVIESILRETDREGQRRRKLPSLELMYFVIALGLYASEGCRRFFEESSFAGVGRKRKISTGSVLTRQSRKVGLG